MHEQRSVKLSDGRQLGFAEYVILTGYLFYIFMGYLEVDLKPVVFMR